MSTTTETPKRLKKNISFSAHEKDIYDYLEGVGNASAFIKRLVLNHMLMEQGLVVPTVVSKPVENNTEQTESQESQESQEPEVPQESEVVEETDSPAEEVEEEVNEEIEENEDASEPSVEMEFTEEDLEIKEIMPEL